MSRKPAKLTPTAIKPARILVASHSHPALTKLVARLRHPEDPAWGELQDLWARRLGALPLLDWQSVLWVDRRLEVASGPLGLYLSTPGAAGWRWH